MRYPDIQMELDLCELPESQRFYTDPLGMKVFSIYSPDGVPTVNSCALIFEGDVEAATTDSTLVDSKAMEFPSEELPIKRWGPNCYAGRIDFTPGDTLTNVHIKVSMMSRCLAALKPLLEGQ